MARRVAASSGLPASSACLTLSCSAVHACARCCCRSQEAADLVMLACKRLICAAGALALFSTASALRAPSRSHCAASAVAASTCSATLAGLSAGLLKNQIPVSTTAAAIHVRKRTGGRGGGTEPLMAGLAGGALAGAAAGGGTGAGAGCGTGTGMGGGTGTGGTTGTGGGMRGSGGGAGTFSRTGAAATWRAPQNGQCATRSSKVRPQAALRHTSFTFSDTLQPFPGFAQLHSAAILPHAGAATASGTRRTPCQPT